MSESSPHKDDSSMRWGKRATESERRSLLSAMSVAMVSGSWKALNGDLEAGKQFREAAEYGDDSELLKAMASYGEGLVEALGSEVDRLETEIQKIVPGIRHVDIEAHNPSEPLSS